jgi:hypothetical protein
MGTCGLINARVGGGTCAGFTDAFTYDVGGVVADRLHRRAIHEDNRGCSAERGATRRHVASAFGLWALAQQQIDGYADAGDDRPLNGPRLGMAWRVARRMGGLVGSLTALALLLEGFAQVMAVVFKCPGCSG